MKTVLFADNDRRFLKARQTILKDAGFNVIAVSSPEEARQALLYYNIHLAILDVRLRDDDDVKDQSGLDLANDPRFRIVPKIIFTNYPTVQVVTKSLTPDGYPLPPAVCFISKDEPIEVMLEKIHAVFKEFVRGNLDIDIEKNPRKMLFSSALVSAIEPDLSNEFITERIKNLEDLFRKLFANYDRIILENYLWNKGNRLALLVGAQTNSHKDHFVVTCGLHESMEDENTRLNALSPRLRDILGVHQIREESVFYVADAWCIQEPEPEEIQSLSSIIREKNDGITRSIVEDLLDRILSEWHIRGRIREQKQNLVTYYRGHNLLNAETFPRELLNKKVDSLLEESFNRHLLQDFNKVNEQLSINLSQIIHLKLPDPVRYLYDETLFPCIHFYRTDSPGSMNWDTILANRNGKAWLTDFSEAGSFPICHDYASLLTGFYLTCLEVIPLMDLVILERQIHQSRSSGEEFRLEHIESEYRKTAGMILSIQEKALQTGGRDPRALDICLFFCAMANLKEYSSTVFYSKNELAAHLNQLILAGLLCAKIYKEKETAIPEEEIQVKHDNLTINPKSNEVRIGTHLVNLTDTEYKILAYLYQNEGKICSKEDIAQNALDSKAYGEAEEAVINTNLGRMRQKIDPVYLITVRSKGIKLVSKPE